MAAYCTCKQNIDYYWRDYSGVVPKDALPGGKDVDGKTTYIGQVYIHEYGLFICEIYPGIQQVEVQCYGVQKVDKDIKILCTRNKFSFTWLPTNSENYHVDTIDRHVVIGGSNYRAKTSPGVLTIGRVMHDGALKTGAVAAHNPEDAQLYFVHNNKQELVKAYEILVYNM